MQATPCPKSTGRCTTACQLPSIPRWCVCGPGSCGATGNLPSGSQTGRAGPRVGRATHSVAATPLVLVDQAAKGHREAAALAATLESPVLECTPELPSWWPAGSLPLRHILPRSSVTTPKACSGLKPGLYGHSPGHWERDGHRLECSCSWQDCVGRQGLVLQLAALGLHHQTSLQVHGSCCTHRSEAACPLSSI